MMNRFLIVILCFLGYTAISQTDSTSLLIQSDSDVDTNISTKFIEHSPKKALLLSAVLPGAGQVYNKQVWKVPIIYAAAGIVTYFAITNGKNKEKFKDEYYNRINGNTDDLLSDYASYTDNGIYNLYNAYKSNFQLSIIVGVALYAVNLLDAYVYGHLFSFDMSDDLSLNIAPYYQPAYNNIASSSFGLSFKFNLR